MKTRITMLLALLLALVCTAASAQEYYTLPEIREQAAQGWHETYEAYGREIVVDVEAQIPNVDQVPIERLEFARMEAHVTEEESGLRIIVRPEENVFVFSTEMFTEQIPGKIEKKSESCIGYPDEWDRVYPLGSMLTLSGAVDVVREALSVMQLDEKNWDLEHPYELSTFSFRNAETKEVVSAGEYMMYFHQLMNGIPLLNHAGATYKEKTRGNATIRLGASVIDRSMYDISPKMLKSAGRVAEDVPLCSFSKVVETIEEEIRAGHIRKVYDLELGYLFYEDPEYVTSDTWTDHFYAVPVWQLNCLYESNRQKELPEYGSDETGDERYSLEYSSFIINAQTGEIQDYMSQKKDRAQYKGFIPWDKVK